MFRIILTILLATLIALPGFAELAYDAGDTSSGKEKAGKSDDDLYRKATKALDQKKWSEAIDLFSQIARRDGPNRDKALYWLAHAQYKSGRAADAIATIETFRNKYPKSPWINDAKALEVEVRQKVGPVSPDNLRDDELKLIALTSLLNTDPDRAITLLEKMLNSPRTSSETKENAMFLLNRTSSPRAQSLLESAARGHFGPELQEDAIHSLGVYGKKNLALLVDIYQKSASADVKESILQSFMTMGERGRLYEVASTESNAGLRGEAARYLGTMRATAELEKLYATEKNGDVKEAIIQGFFIAGDVAKLTSLARTEKNPELRSEAIRSLGTLGQSRTGEFLMQLWNEANDSDTREALIDAFFVQGNARALISLARKEQNRQVKREIVERLSLMNSKEAREYMLELLQD